MPTEFFAVSHFRDRPRNAHAPARSPTRARRRRTAGAPGDFRNYADFPRSRRIGGFCGRPTPPPILTNEVGARYRQNPYCRVRKPLASVWELSYKPWFPRAAREILAAGYQVEGKQVPEDFVQQLLILFC